ncbi:MAG: hypothetical protein MJZ57_06145 [Bacteroidales bacterium]|nr:hypothetical protein [Bacteroidales bacterium]
MKRMILLVGVLALTTLTYAQVVDSAHLLINYVPKLVNSNKINEQAETLDTLQEKINFTYSVSPQKPELNFIPAALKVSKLNPQVQERYYRNYLKLGFGYPITPLAELSMHNCQNNKYSYGLNFHHFSSWAEPIGKVQKQFAYAPTSDTRVNLFLNRYFKNQTLYSSVGYNHELANLFGYSKEWMTGLIDTGYYYSKDYRDSIRNSFNHVRAEIGIRSNYTTEDKRFKEDVRLNYDFIHTYWKDMEHEVGLHSIFAYDARFLKISGYQHYQLDFNVEYFNNSWNDSIWYGVETGNPHLVKQVENSFKIELRPMMNFTIKEYHLLLGVGVPLLNANGETMCPVYPIAELQMGLVRGLLSLYVGVDGKSEYNSLKNLLYENPYVKPQLDSLRFTRRQISIYGGVKGNLVDRLNYHISARYTYAKDVPFFALDQNSLLMNRFDVVYAEKANLLNACANLSWEAIDHLYLNLNANYWGYYFMANAQHPEHPWYKPAWEIGFEGKYVLNKKFVFELNAKTGFDRWAMVPAQMHAVHKSADRTNNPSVSADDYDVLVCFSEKVKKPILNFGLGFEYLINKQFTVWAAVNNVGCQYASTYYAFNNFGINVMAGITYSFGNEPIKPAKKKKQL